MYVKSIEFMIKAHSLLTASRRPSAVKLTFGGVGVGNDTKSARVFASHELRERRNGVLTPTWRSIRNGWMIDEWMGCKERAAHDGEGKRTAGSVFSSVSGFNTTRCLVCCSFKKAQSSHSTWPHSASHSPWSRLWRWGEPAGVFYTGTLLPLSALWLRSNNKITSYHGA